jgi:hypothetical protein
LRQQVLSERTMGNEERAWELERDMVTIARQHHDDIRMLPVFRGLADDRLALVEQVRAGERPPVIYVGCYNGAPPPPYDYTGGASSAMAGTLTSPCIGGINQDLIAKLRAEILMYYADAIETILETGDYASAELRQFETAALRIADAGRGRGVMSSKSSGSFGICSSATLDQFLALEILGTCLAPVGRGTGWVVANVGNVVSLIRLISYEMRQLKRAPSPGSRTGMSSPYPRSVAATRAMTSWRSHFTNEPTGSSGKVTIFRLRRRCSLRSSP